MQQLTPATATRQPSGETERLGPSLQRAQVNLQDALAGMHLLLRLPRLLRTPISTAEAKAALRNRFERREADFLALVRSGVYETPRNPFRAMLTHAGCGPDDLARLVRLEGVEGALRVLLRAGVYVTVDELKGRRPIVRGSLSLEVDPRYFRNPGARMGIPVTSGGSRGPGLRLDTDLELLWESFTDIRLFLDARGGLDWRFAVWGVPGGVTVAQLAGLAVTSRFAPQFVSRISPRAAGAKRPGYWGSLLLIRAAGRLAGRPFPPAFHASITDPTPLVRWLDVVRAHGETPHVQLYASAAVRLAEAALAMGTDLQGVQLILSGEPVTAARRAAAERCGAMVFPQMGNTETGTVIARGCLAPDGSDDMHLLHDLLALIQPGDVEIPGLPREALLASSIRPRAPLVLLNASLGDVGTLSNRACRCPLADLGWTTHLAEVRSFEKLTAGGMTFYNADLAHVLEVVLPSRFGGGPLDYQLVEREEQDGSPALFLYVHPAIGPLDSAAVVAAFLDAIGHGRSLEWVMGETWREAGFLRVERRPPQATRGGKIQSLHSTLRHPGGMR